MVTSAEMNETLEAYVSGTADASGRTPLDNLVESLKGVSSSQVSETLVSLVDKAMESEPAYAKAFRELIRRVGLKDETLAAKIQGNVNNKAVAQNGEQRLWLSLALMDIGFPRTIPALKRDKYLRSKHIGQWLTLIAANNDLSAVESEFDQAVRESLVTVEQLCIKADVVRKRFGDGLTHFLNVMDNSINNTGDRTKFRSLVLKMYGVTLGGKLPGPLITHAWMQQKTVDLLTSIKEEDAIRREKLAA